MTDDKIRKMAEKVATIDLQNYPTQDYLKVIGATKQAFEAVKTSKEEFPKKFIGLNNINISTKINSNTNSNANTDINNTKKIENHKIQTNNSNKENIIKIFYLIQRTNEGFEFLKPFFAYIE